MDFGGIFGTIIKIFVYMAIVRVIMSKVNKNKNVNSSKTNRRTHTHKTPDMPIKYKRTTMEPRKPKSKKQEKNIDLNISLNGLKNLIPKSHEDLGPMERMAKRERELENRNKR